MTSDPIFPARTGVYGCAKIRASSSGPAWT